jgi:hypothetical protein
MPNASTSCPAFKVSEITEGERRQIVCVDLDHGDIGLIVRSTAKCPDWIGTLWTAECFGG